MNNDPKDEREATEDEIKFYFKNKKENLNGNSSSNITIIDVNQSGESCTAIVLKPDSDGFSDKKNIIKSTSDFWETRSLLENKFGAKFNLNKNRIKEKNLVIKVKKNLNEEENEKDKKTNENIKENSEVKIESNSQTIYNEIGKAIMKPNDSIHRNKDQGVNEINDYINKCNIKEETKESLKVKTERLIDDYENYEEESNNNENGFMEPLF